MKIPTIRESIADHGVHIGTGRAYSCCGKFMLFRIQVGPHPDDAYLVCNYCDTEK